MTTTVVITAHPAAPACSVLVHRQEEDGSVTSHALEHGATFYTSISGKQSLSVTETPVRMVRKPETV